MKFEWDTRKALLNQQKHRVSFEEAATVWTDPLALIAADPGVIKGEEREWIIGESNRLRVLVVVYTVRGNTVRIISARLASRGEKRRYEEEG